MHLASKHTRGIRISNMKKYTLKKFPNGLVTLTVPSKGNKAVTVMVLVKAGSEYESKEINGLSHFLEHMCFQGTKNRPQSGQVSKDLDALGAQSNAFTSNEYTGYWAKAHSSKIEKVMEIVSDIYQNPIFAPDAIEREKGVVVEEIKMYEDLPQHKVAEVFEEHLYGDQAAGRPVIGNEKNVKGFTKLDLEQYRNSHYVAEKTMVVVAGDVTSKQAEALVKKYFKEIARGKVIKKEKTKDHNPEEKIKIHHKTTDQAHLIIGFKSFPIGHKLTPVASLLSTVLGQGMSSRLFKKLRDELGLCYYVSAANHTAYDHGFFTVSAGVAKDRIEEAVSAICEELRKIKNNLVEKSELEKAKEFRVGNMYLNLETSDAVADFYSFQKLYDLNVKTPEEKEKIIKKISAKELQSLASKIFANDNLYMAVVGPYKDAATLKGKLVL